MRRVILLAMSHISGVRTSRSPQYSGSSEVMPLILWATTSVIFRPSCGKRPLARIARRGSRPGGASGAKSPNSPLRIPGILVTIYV